MTITPMPLYVIDAAMWKIYIDALKQQAAALESQRRGILAEIAVLEKMEEMREGENGREL